MYEYSAVIVRVVDGDTLHLDVNLGLDVYVKTIVRLYGLNAPELSTAAGKVARQFVLDWVTSYGAAVSIITVKDKREKYGRYLATVYSPSLLNLNQMLLDSGNAVVYLP